MSSERILNEYLLMLVKNNFYRFNYLQKLTLMPEQWESDCGWARYKQTFY